MLQTILLVAMILISIALTGVILLQRSEGGALGMGGGPSGFMTARGAGNLLTRTTEILAVAFFACALGLTIVGNMDRAERSVATSESVGSRDVTLPANTAPAPTDAPAADPAQPAAPTLDDLESSLGGSSAQPAPAQPGPAQ